MKYIKIILRDKSEISLPFEKAEKLLDSPSQLIKITNDKGEWTGETINKSEIIFTGRDFQKERDEDSLTALPETTESPEELRLKRANLIDKFKPDFLK